jgi:small subunit ribosomal protein S2
VGMPYVNQRWLGGMLTNFSTVHKRLQRLKELELIDFDDVAASGITKKELLVLKREKVKLEKILGGIRDMTRVPSAVWLVDTKKEHIAVAEARKLHIPVVAILDTNCDPDEVDFPIPGNDDAIRAVGLLTRVIADAVAEGLMARAGVGQTDDKPGAELGGGEPLADWERELLAVDSTDAPAADPAAAEAAAVVEVAEAIEAVEVAAVAQVIADVEVAEAVEALEALDLAEATGDIEAIEAAEAVADVEVAEAIEAVEVAEVAKVIATAEVAEAVEAVEALPAADNPEQA